MSSNQGLFPPDDLIDHSPLIKVVSWFLLVVSTLTIITRLITRWSVSKVFQLDDILASCSFVNFDLDKISTLLIFVQFCFVGSVVAVSVQAENGLGKPRNASSQAQFATFSRVN